MIINTRTFVLLVMICLLIFSCRQKQNRAAKAGNKPEFVKEMVEFVPYDYNPLFSGTEADTWDKYIRERGFILFEEGIYKMWYTGYSGGGDDPKSLGYATSEDGINWTRYPQNPIFSEKWTEDMFVMKYGESYFMYAEGKNDIAHLLTSSDGIKWEEQGDLVIITVKGDTIPGPYGTPSVLVEDGKWYLFYERNDEGIWLAASKDHITWKNVQDNPVLEKGLEMYDAGAVAANQIIKYKGNYYMYYHGSTDADWDVPGASSIWTSNVAISSDLVHWVKYPKNPIVDGDHSSPVMVNDGSEYRIYTMHDKMCLYFSK